MWQYALSPNCCFWFVLLIALRGGEGGSIDPTIFDGLVKATMDCRRIPGMSVGFVQNNQLVYARGYGHRDIENNLPFTAETTTTIASMSKSFTGAVIGTLIDKKVLSLESRVKTFIPDFELKDPIGSQVRIRDLVTHRWGLSRNDLGWIMGSCPQQPDEFAHSLRYLDFNRPFRWNSQYSNLGWFLAGHTAAKAAGQDWHSLIKENLLTPLGMTQTTTNLTEAMQRTGSDQYAIPYEVDTSKSTGWRRLPRDANRVLNVVCPAGCVVSNIFDLAKYVLFHMNNGTSNATGSSVVSVGTINILHSRLQSFPDYLHYTPRYPLNRLYIVPDYGVGLWIGTFRGYKVIQHSGTGFGMSSMMIMLPELGIAGFALFLTSTSHTARVELLLQGIDMLLGFPPALNASTICPHNNNNDDTYSVEGPDVPPNQFLATQENSEVGVIDASSYSGTFTHPSYGNITIVMVMQGTSSLGKLQWTMGRAYGRLIPTPVKDTFNMSVTEEIRSTPHWVYSPVIFHRNVHTHQVDAIRIPLDYRIPAIVFVKAGANVNTTADCTGMCPNPVSGCKAYDAHYTCLLTNLCKVPEELCQQLFRCGIKKLGCWQS